MNLKDIPPDRPPIRELRKEVEQLKKQNAQLEAEALALSGDAAYLVHFNVPGIMLIGGIEGALALTDYPVETF